MMGVFKSRHGMGRTVFILFLKDIFDNLKQRVAKMARRVAVVHWCAFHMDTEWEERLIFCLPSGSQHFGS